MTRTTADLAITPSPLALTPVLIERLIAALETLTSPTSDPELKLYTPEEAAALLGVTEHWVTERIKTRRIPCTFVGRFPRLSAAHIRAIHREGEFDPKTRRPKRTA